MSTVLSLKLSSLTPPLFSCQPRLFLGPRVNIKREQRIEKDKFTHSLSARVAALEDDEEEGAPLVLVPRGCVCVCCVCGVLVSCLVSAAAILVHLGPEQPNLVWGFKDIFAVQLYPFSCTGCRPLKKASRSSRMPRSLTVQSDREKAGNCRCGPWVATCRRWASAISELFACAAHGAGDLQWAVVSQKAPKLHTA